jgi:hypothetical protein
MNDVLTAIQRWIEHHPPQLWAVVSVALALAWLDRNAGVRRTHRYDAWWLFNLRRSDGKADRPRGS